MKTIYDFKSLEIGGKIVRFRIEESEEYINSVENIINNYEQVDIKEEYNGILHNTDIVYNFLLENNIAGMDMIKPIAPAMQSSSDINAEILRNCEESIRKFYALDYLNERDFIDTWKEIAKQWYDSKMYISGYRCTDVMQVSLSGIHYVAPCVLDIRRNMLKVLEQPFDNRLVAAIVTMYMIEYIYPFSVMTGVMARLTLQYYLQMPGVQVCKELYMNSHRYRKMFLDCTKMDDSGTIDITAYFEYMCSLISVAWGRYYDKSIPLTEDEKDAYDTLLQKAEKSSFVMPIHLAVVALRIRYDDGIKMLNSLGIHGYVEFTDSNNIVVHKREE